MKSFCFIVSLLFTTISYGQFQIGPGSDMVWFTGEMKKKTIDEVRTTTAYFVYTSKDEAYLEDLKRELRLVWTISKLEFISHSDTKDTSFQRKGVFLALDYGFHTRTRNDHKFIDLTLYLTVEKYDGENYIDLARMMLSPEIEYEDTLIELSVELEGVISNIDFESPDKEVKEIALNEFFQQSAVFKDFIYSEVSYYNWNIGHLKKGLKFINDKLEYVSTMDITKETIHGELRNLKQDTLYIPEYAYNYCRDKKPGDSGSRVLENLMAKYKFPYKVISTEELERMLISNESDFYYLNLVKSGYNKYIGVINGFSGEVVYSNYDGFDKDGLDLSKINARSFLFYQADIQKLAYAIKTQQR